MRPSIFLVRSLVRLAYANVVLYINSYSILEHLKIKVDLFQLILCEINIFKHKIICEYVFVERHQLVNSQIHCCEFHGFSEYIFRSWQLLMSINIKFGRSQKSSCLRYLIGLPFNFRFKSSSILVKSPRSTNDRDSPLKSKPFKPLKICADGLRLNWSSSTVLKALSTEKCRRT